MSDPSPSNLFPSIFGATGSDAELYASGFVFGISTCVVFGCLLLRHRLEEKTSMTAARPWFKFLQLMIIALSFRCIWCFLSGAHAFNGGTRKQCLTSLECAGPILITALNRISMLIYFAAFAIFSGQLIRIGRGSKVAAAVSTAVVEDRSRNSSASSHVSSTSRADPFIKRCDLLFLLVSVWLFVVQMIILGVSLFTTLPDARADSIYNGYIVMVAVLNLILVIAILCGSYYVGGYLRSLEAHHASQGRRLKQMVALVVTAATGAASFGHEASASSSAAAALAALLAAFPGAHGATGSGKGVFGADASSTAPPSGIGGGDDYESDEDATGGNDSGGAGLFKRQGGKVISSLRVAADIRHQLRAVKKATVMGGTALTQAGKAAAAGGRALLSAIPVSAAGDGRGTSASGARGSQRSGTEVVISMLPASSSTATSASSLAAVASAALAETPSAAVVPVTDSPLGPTQLQPSSQRLDSVTTARASVQQPLTALAAVPLPATNRDQRYYEELIVQRGVREAYYSQERRAQDEKQWRDEVEGRRKKLEKEADSNSRKSAKGKKRVQAAPLTASHDPESVTVSLLAHEHGSDMPAVDSTAHSQAPASAGAPVGRGRMDKRRDRVAAAASSSSPSRASASLLFRSAASRSPSRGRNAGASKGLDGSASASSLSLLLLPEENLNQRPYGEEHDSGVQLASIGSSLSPPAVPAADDEYLRPSPPAPQRQTSRVPVLVSASGSSQRAVGSQPGADDPALASLLSYARGLMRTHEETRSKLSLWRREVLFLCLVISLLFSIKSVMFALRPVFNVSLGGMAGVVSYPWFFYTIPEALPAVLVALTISGLPLHLPLVFLYQLVESAVKLAASCCCALACCFSIPHWLAITACYCCCRTRSNRHRAADQAGAYSGIGADDGADGDDSGDAFSTLVKAAMAEDSQALEKRRLFGCCRGDRATADDDRAAHLLPRLQFGGVRAYLSSFEQTIAATLREPPAGAAPVDGTYAHAQDIADLGNRFVEALAYQRGYLLLSRPDVDERSGLELHAGLVDKCAT